MGEVSTLRFHGVSESPKASVIIPTLDGDRNGNLSRLLQDLCRQNYDSFEVHVVKGVKPQGKAINAGADKSKAPLLIILDDDSTVPNANTFSNLCDVVQKDALVGMAGASVVISPESNRFQQRAAKQFPRFNMPIAEKVLESDMASHGCCVIPRSLFYEIGREKETIFRGLDPDLRQRLRLAGYKTVLAPQTWVYHPLSPTFVKLMKQFYRNGVGSAHAWLVDPKTVFQTHEKADLKGFVPRRSFVYRAMRFPLRLLHALVTLRVIRCAAYSGYALGFVYGLFKYSLVKKVTV
jgi:GT2 family glycosyltransferase